MSILDCNNPNFLAVYLEWQQSKSKKSKHKKKVEFISRQRYLENNTNPLIRYYQTRCNNCLGCKLFKGYQWANRLLAESYTNTITYFITLTFIDEMLEYFKINESKSVMRPVQLFMKRLRKKYKDLKFKYFAVAELGGKTLRFHYHMILFSPVDIFGDKVYYQSSNGYDLYINDILQSLWQYGNAPFNIAEFNTMRYTANYVQGKGNVLGHSYSRNIGNDWIKNNSWDDVYYINGMLSKVPKNLQNKDKFEKYKETISLDEFKYLNLDNEAFYQSLEAKSRNLNKQKQYKKT